MMRQLEEETRALLSDSELPPSKLNHRYAFNLFSHNTAIGADGYNEEESKVIEETRKILGTQDQRDVCQGAGSTGSYRNGDDRI